MIDQSLAVRVRRWFAVAAFALTVGGCGGVRVTPARFDDLGGRSFGGIALDTRGDLPTINELVDARRRDGFDDYEFGTSPMSLTIKGLPEGEVETFRIEFVDPEPGPYEPNPGDRDETELESAERWRRKASASVMAVIAEPRFRGLIDLAEAQRTLRFELRELVTLSHDGPIFRTTRDDWLAIVRPWGDSLELRAIAVAYDPTFFRYGDNLASADFERVLREEPARFIARIPALKVAMQAGSAEAASIGARLVTLADERAAPQMAALAAKFTSAPLEERLTLLRDAIAATDAADDLCGAVPPKAAAAFEKLRADLAHQFTAAAADVRAADRHYEADGYETLAASLESLDSEHAPSTVGRSIEEAERILPTARELDAMMLTEKINRHRDLQKDLIGTPSTCTELFATAVRTRLASELAESAHAAAADNRHATACCRYLLAHGVRGGELSPEQGVKPLATATLAAVAKQPQSDADSDLTKARREAVVLAKRLLPVVREYALYSSSCTALFDGGGLLAGLPIATRLGLATGNLAAQARFASELGAELLTIEFDDPKLTLHRANRSEMATKKLYRTAVVDNVAEVSDWQRRIRALEDRIDGMNSSIESNLRASGTVTATGGSNERYLDTVGNLTYYEVGQPYELASSILDRANSLGRAEKEAEQLPLLRSELELLRVQRPPDERVEDRSFMVDYVRDIQVWKVHVERVARLVGPITPQHEVTGAQDLELNYLRISADPAKELKRVDEWRTEEAIRADRPLFDASLPGYARIALRDLLNARLAALDHEIDQRGLAEVDEITERRWLTWLFVDRASHVDDDVGKSVASQDKVVEAAFTGAPAPAAPDTASPPELDDAAIDQEHLWEAAETYFQARKYMAAEALFWRVARHSSDARGFAMLANARVQLWDHRGALAAYTKCAELAPDWIPGRLAVAMMHALLDEWESASTVYDACLSKASDAEVAEAITITSHHAKQHPGSEAIKKALERLRSH